MVVYPPNLLPTSHSLQHGDSIADLPAVGCVILGSLLPDVDSPNSSLGRIVPFVSIPLERRYGHRTITHSLLALFALAALAVPLLFSWTACYVGLLLGFLSLIAIFLSFSLPV